ncbi:UDP-N-acetylmuramate dehydrogenase [Phocea massiliensis]|uniref:UDP-N-acetylenolpyruvoylglucosamine reductase n=1 Tax=Merdimmobilis hominis TaxID=2897707 RepID=A0A938X4D8_9FIRM|nr:UDP-N-acetylmuramate dehydrogenase [Merdimmobilis hominis]MBM6920537.1 UDP-N-acetylmuramate dehydrogenase [Merdimmobilis hominis]
MFDKLIERLKNESIPYKENIRLRDYTTFQIGGNCPLAVSPETAAQMQTVTTWLLENDCPYFVLGKGSNILASDNGYDGVLILTQSLRTIEKNENTVRCGAGVSLSKLCAFAASHALSGLEFAWGIPGSVGGAVYMNAGAYGGEIVDVIKSATFLEEDGTIRTLPAEELDLTYRHSCFTGTKRIILEAEFSLHPDEKEAISARMDDYIGRRTSKQPLDKPSAGSTFKRPKGGYASALIEQCGLKGFTIGGAQVSEKHSGFLINCGDATAADMEALIHHVQRVVKEQTGFSLECEVIHLGF